MLVIATTLLGQFLWALPGWSPGWFSPRIFTIWSLFQIAFLIVMAGRLIDACHLHSIWNIRALTVLAVVGWLWLVPGDTVGRFWRLPPRPTERVASPRSEPNTGATAVAAPSVVADQSPEQAEEAPTSTAPIMASTLPMDETVIELWFRAMEARIAQTDPDHPVIIVAASGGGARAAMFTALVFEALRSTPLPAVPASCRAGPVRRGRAGVSRVVPGEQAKSPQSRRRGCRARGFQCIGTRDDD